MGRVVRGWRALHSSTCYCSCTNYLRLVVIVIVIQRGWNVSITELPPCIIIILQVGVWN